MSSIKNPDQLLSNPLDLSPVPINQIEPGYPPFCVRMFQALDEIDGVIIRVNDQTDLRWHTLIQAGLPPDMERVDIIFSVAPYNSRYKDFAILGKGVVADAANPEKGKGPWAWTLAMGRTGEQFTVHIWLIDIYRRNSHTHLLAHYNAGTNESYTNVQGGSGKGTRVELNDVRWKNDKQSALRLLSNSDDLLRDLQNILQAANTAHRGRKPKATVAPETILLWSQQYDNALTALQSELQNRGRKQFKKYEQQERLLIIKRVFSGIDNNIAESLSTQASLADVALRYTGWVCSKIEIGTWQSTQYGNILRKSDKFNNVVRKGNKQSNRKAQKSGSENSKKELVNNFREKSGSENR